MSQQPSPAQLYEDSLVRYQLRPFAADLVARAAPRPGERVLDLACGTGIVARLVAPRVAPGGSVTGLDVLPGMLAVARERATAEGVDVSWDEGNATSLPYTDGTFDLALCQQGLQHFPDKPSALRELHRVLTPGGRALVSVWGARSPVLDTFQDIVEQHLGVPPPAAPFSLTNADEVRTLLQGAGFGAAEITPVEQTVRYPNLREFVLRTVQTVQAMAAQAMAAIPPDLAALPPEEITVKADGITAEFAPLVQTYRDGDGLAFPMRTNVALVRR